MKKSMIEPTPVAATPEIEVIPVGDLHLDPANARKHDARNLAAIKASLARFGQVHPIIIDTNNVVRAGNGRLQAARALGWPTVNCVRTDLDGADAMAFAIADNRTAELASWDDQVLSQTLQALQDEDYDLASIGFTDKEVDALVDSLSGDDARDDEDEGEGDEVVLAEKWMVVVECRDEQHQVELLERFKGENLICKAIVG
jgi:ParB-like chromosome segregation protein Spo0J